jgi:hypothetical protein
MCINFEDEKNKSNPSWEFSVEFGVYHKYKSILCELKDFKGKETLRQMNEIGIIELLYKVSLSGKVEKLQRN